MALSCTCRIGNISADALLQFIIFSSEIIHFPLSIVQGTDPSYKAKLDDDTKDSSVETSSVGVITDPECLGPCEPGTSVVLEGIVWNETENGNQMYIAKYDFGGCFLSLCT